MGRSRGCELLGNLLPTGAFPTPMVHANSVTTHVSEYVIDSDARLSL
jgi:hypothetical protein